MAAFPGALASFAGFVATHTLAADNHAAQHNLEQAEILAVQTKVGTGAATPTSGTVLRGTGAGTSTWGQVALTSDVTGVLPVANGGNGTTSTTGTGSAVFGTSPTISGASLTGSPTLTTPTIADYTNAIHTHASNAQGGQLNFSNILGTLTSIQLALFSNMQVLTFTTTGNFTTGNNVLGSPVTVNFPSGITKAIIIGQIRLQSQSNTQGDFRAWVGLDGTTSCLRQDVIFTPAQANDTFESATCAMISDVTGLSAGDHTFQVYGSASSGTASAGACTILVIPIAG